ncbi:hypothetical protein PRK78_004475 [Emydomyces testavorans]|uniref:Zn(2)-C6 fungal-type domain-containing protein n=1 Tax=Emydomyces testavorans TaxID=2070801 RepID=A0AAF0IJK1_9EURO|nr:hypothetical protein PRK78_004475 [Emydomyces testavorans]
MEARQHVPPSAQSASSTSSAPPPHAPSQHHHQSPDSHYSNQSPPNGDGAASRGVDIASHDPLADLKRPRACETCRQLKVRCDPDPDHPDGSCKRCAKANRRCIVTVPSRKRQKKADSRVAELERRIDALTASLQASRAQNSVGEQLEAPSRRTSEQEGPGGRWLGHFASRNNSSSAPRSNRSSSFAPTAFAGTKRNHSGEFKRGFLSPLLAPLPAREKSPFGDGPTIADHAAIYGGNKGEWPSLYSTFDTVPKPRVENEFRDVIDRAIVDVETATKAFDRYVNDMAPTAPFVVFSPGTTMSEVRRTRPILFLSILSVSVAVFRPQLQMLLQNEIHRIFADRVLVRGEKSLELVQALLIATIWYNPPEHFEELKFYQFIHTAAVMGVDIGMNRKTKANSKTLGMWKELFGNKTPIVDAESLEARRAWLGCYSMAVNCSMSLRRPLFIRWQSYNDESIEMLKNSPDALPSDKSLIQWVKLAHIGEDVSFQFSMDDPTTNVSITDPKIQYALKGFERQLEDWRKEVPPEAYSPSMEHYEHILNVYMHEIGMHVDHNIDDFKPPFLGEIGEEGQVDLGTAAHVDALTACLTSAHRSFQLFCSIDHRDLLCLPTMQFVRTTYASVALVKLFSLAISSGSKLNHIFNPADFKVEYFLDKLMHHLRACGDTDGGRRGAKFALMVAMLKSWYMRSKDKRQPLMVPAFFRPKDSADSDSDSLKMTSTNAAPTPLHVLSEVATGRSSDTNSKQENIQQTQVPQASQSNALRGSPVTMHSNSDTIHSSQPVSTTRPIVSDACTTAPSIFMTPYMNQQMGLSSIPASHHAITAEYQPTYSQRESFPQGPEAMDDTGQQQQDLWLQGFLPDADLNLALAFQGNVWDDDFFPFSFEWSDKTF